MNLKDNPLPPQPPNSIKPTTWIMWIMHIRGDLLPHHTDFHEFMLEPERRSTVASLQGSRCLLQGAQAKSPLCTYASTRWPKIHRPSKLVASLPWQIVHSTDMMKSCFKYMSQINHFKSLLYLRRNKVDFSWKYRLGDFLATLPLAPGGGWFWMRIYCDCCKTKQNDKIPVL